MKIKLLVVLLLASFVGYAQDTPYVRPVTFTTMGQNYRFYNQLKVDSPTTLRKLLVKDSTGFQGVTTVPMAPNGDSSNKVASTGWITRNMPGQQNGAGTNKCANSLVGGRVTWNSLLIFDVTSASYCIGGTTYNSPTDTVHLTTAHSTLNRIDVVAVDTNGLVVVITGTPATDPAVPQVDPASQYFLTSVLVPAGSTTPSGVSSVLIWNENIGSPEWVASKTGSATVNFNGTTSPYVGTKTTDGGTFSPLFAGRHNIKYEGTDYSVNTYNTLKFFINLKAALAATANIYVSILSNGVLVTPPLLISNNQGLNKAVFGQYQNISADLKDFAFNTAVTTIDGILITTTGSGTGFYIDYITLTGGVTTYVPSPILLTTNGSSGAATLLGNTLNIPNYAGGSTDTTSLSNRINLKQNLVTLTTTGSSGAATFNQSTGALNIPNYASGVGSTDSTRLSAHGIISDADLSFGSSTFGTDQTAAIQAVLNTASATNPLYIIWDVKVSTTGLKIKSNTRIQGLPGMGAILRDSADNFLFSNYNWVGQSNAFVDSNIVVDGIIMNGNGFRGGAAKQRHSDSTHGMITGFNFSGVKRISLTNFSIINCRTYAGFFMTTEDCVIDHMNLDQGVAPIMNQDGINWVGYAKNIFVKNCVIRTGDDRLAFGANAAGGTNGTENHVPYTGVNGDQDFIVIDNIKFNGRGKGVSLYDFGANQMSNYFISNVSGTASTYWFAVFNQDVIAGSGYDYSNGSLMPRNIFIENVSVEVVEYLGYDPAGYGTVNLNCSIENISFRNIKRNNYTVNSNTFKSTNLHGATGITISSWKIDGYDTKNITPETGFNHIQIVGATVSNLNVSNTYLNVGSTPLENAFIYLGAFGNVTNLIATANHFTGLNYMIVVGTNGVAEYLNFTGVAQLGTVAAQTIVNGGGTISVARVSNWIGNTLSSGTIGSLKGDATLP